ncbi:hypothetical protein A0H81_08373 [Grifola frondosa]|uniref:Uncharacterized protein n=1 Tax=Grifola frondosa TaxID=5627 RepID=A0A1C7M3T8_GRIFR|nr:hypothetical protein A0H81_08373 [Grifola frondosa]
MRRISSAAAAQDNLAEENINDGYTEQGAAYAGSSTSRSQSLSPQPLSQPPPSTTSETHDIATSSDDTIQDRWSLHDLATESHVDLSTSEDPVVPNHDANIIDPSELPSEALGDPPTIHLEELKIAQKFIDALKNASLDDDQLDPSVLDQLRNSVHAPLEIDDPDLRLSLDIYLAVSNASQDTYNDVRAAILRRYPDSAIFTYDQIKSRLSELSGIVSILRDMCINTCAPIQALLPILTDARSAVNTAMISRSLRDVENELLADSFIPFRLVHSYRLYGGVLLELTQNGQIPVFEDFCFGEDYIDHVEAGKICPDDMTLMLSLDGAQLYQSKTSDCWIYIWVILDHAPDTRYKKKYVLPGAIIPGPNKPKNVDSFLFPGIHHLSALQTEGLSIWDAHLGRKFTSYPFLALVTADGPGMTYLNGLVGHSGAYGCRLYCSMKGRHKPGGTHYFPAALKPTNYDVPGCEHADVNLRSLEPDESAAQRYVKNLYYLQESRTPTDYKKRRLQTGIAKPSLFSGLPPHHNMGILGMFGADLMHLLALNIPDLLLSLWRGTLYCEKSDDKVTWDWATLKGDTWKVHGAMVAAATPYLPGSFDRPPRNPAEKMSSGYKAWEFSMYLWGLGPGLFCFDLPRTYWRNYCKLVHGIHLIHQPKITADQLREAHKLLIEFVEEFEILYYQRNVDRLHFVRQSIHALTHLSPESIRLGPGIYRTQWTMERTIGNLDEEIKQPSNPFANLAQRALRRCQVNALKAMIPDLDPEKGMPSNALNLNDGYFLLHATDSTSRKVTAREAAALRIFMESATGLSADGWIPEVTRWAWLQLPNGQIARSLWKEQNKRLEEVRMARNVKFHLEHGQPQLGMVNFYCLLDVEGVRKAVAVVSRYSERDAVLFSESSETLWSLTLSLNGGEKEERGRRQNTKGSASASSSRAGSVVGRRKQMRMLNGCMYSTRRNVNANPFMNVRTEEPEFVEWGYGGMGSVKGGGVGSSVWARVQTGNSSLTAKAAADEDDGGGRRG